MFTTIKRKPSHHHFERSRSRYANPEVCRKHGVDQGTFYIWQFKYGTMKAADIHQMKELEE